METDNQNKEGEKKMENAALQVETPVVVKRPGKRKLKAPNERYARINITVSPLAYENYLKLEMPSKRISDFLERIKKEVETD